MKKSAAFILLLIFSFQAFYAGSFAMWFFANRKYVAEKLCVNKNRPALKCNGKCYLGKKLKQSQEGNDEESVPSLKRWEETAPCVIATIHFHIPQLLQRNHYKPAPVNRYSFIHYLDVFHPPAAMQA